ncbi:arylesterase [Marinospirillum alkaliphilum]|uniref:Acyl-CoA thioesterase-1 n=1 Tax=Marinospirillum alkaliphilum DSM 21637 TaxID=1122209 RepID=A0A1K1V491_9GAMM|nr:arylesterase [Marinospirillum alkaliphilum]SFX19958.1 acyl-CoA thioesterase-1 [Marinospirillum alkaliphilum DSM 21637]
MCFPCSGIKESSLKKIRWWPVVLLLFFTAPALAERSPVLLVMGDSLSAAYNIPADSGWVSLLEQRLQQQGLNHQGQPWRVVNASVSGETTSGGLTRLPALLRQHQPQIVLLELGANDGLRGQPIPRIHNNLNQMIRMSRDQGAEVLLLGILLPPNYGPRYTDQFAALYPELAAANRLPLVPFLLAGVADQPGLMQQDGLHPTAEAQAIILDNVWPKLYPLLR